MNKTVLKLALVGASLAATGQAQAVTTTYAGNGHQYEFFATNLSWNDALAAAAVATPIAGYTAHLVTITSAGEDAFVKTLAGNATFVWAAGTDAALEGTWTWAAGPEAGQTFYILGGPIVGYSNWNPGEPNNTGLENYLHINANADNNWNDISANFPSGGYVVEYSPDGAVPEPATWAMLLAGFALTGTALRRRSRPSSVTA